uniref:Uncharacterized protein n=1 Tax=Panagrellus redivivus TaxID=6233 RepID=A0A7E4W4V4_PANRE
MQTCSSTLSFTFTGPPSANPVMRAIGHCCPRHNNCPPRSSKSAAAAADQTKFSQIVHALRASASPIARPNLNGFQNKLEGYFLLNHDGESCLSLLSFACN